MSDSQTPAGSASSSIQTELDTTSHRQRGKLSLLPQDAHPTLGSHLLQYFLLLQMKILCFSWFLAHLGLVPVHGHKNHKEYFKSQELQCLVPVSDFTSLEKQVISVHCNKAVAYSMPVGTKHSMSSPAYHPHTRLFSSHKAGRSDTLWKPCSGSAHSVT